jgi:lysozyme
MVKDPGAGAPINIDTRAAVGAVTLDVRGAMAADLGQAKMGEAIADAGSYLSQLAVKQMQAINVTKVAEAQDIMAEAEANMKVAMLKEPDELKWEGIATEHATMAQGRISKMALSPVAKQQVDSDFSRWQAHRTGQVKVDSARQSFDKVTTKLKNQLTLNMERQDPEGFADNLMGGKQLGILTDEDIELQQLKYAERGKQLLAEKEADDYKNGVTAAVAVAAASGEQAALGELERGAMGNLNALQKERVRSAIQSVARDRAQTIIGEVTEDIVNGTLEDESQIKAINSPHMTPALKKHAMDILRDFNADEARKDREVNGVRNAVELRRKVKDYDSSTDPDRIKYFTLVKEIGSRADQTSAGELTGELYQKYGGKPPKMQVRPEIEQNVSQSLDITFDPEIGAIPWRRKVPVLDGKGKPVLDSNDNPKFTMVDDLAAKQQALDAQTVIEIEMSKWFALHPDKAGDIGAVQEALQLALPNGTRMAALLGIQREKQSKSVNAVPPNLGAEGDRGPAGAEFMNPMGANNPAYAPVGNKGPSGLLSEMLIDEVKDMESFIPKAYGDYKQSSVGYGTRAKHDDEVLTKGEADTRLREELTMHAERIDRSALKTGVKLTPGQRNALISFDFNTGRGGYLLEDSQGDLTEVRRRMLLYTKAGGKELPGLVKRRKREATIFDL